MSNIFENKGAFAATIVVAASDSLNESAANYVCDGTDDQEEIQAAHDALPATGGAIILLAGNYSISAAIIISKDFVSFIGENHWAGHFGGGVELVSTAFAGNMFENNGAVESILFDGLNINHSGATSGAGISLGASNSVNYSRITNCFVRGKEYAVYVGGADQIWVTDSSIWNGTLAALRAGGQYVFVRGNQFVGGRYQVEVEGQSRMVSIYGNHFEQGVERGIYLHHSSGSDTMERVIANNMFCRQAGDGIELLYQRGVAIIGNVFASDTDGWGTGHHAIFCNACEDLTIVGNDIRDPGTASSGAYAGIFLDTVNDSVISGNHISTPVKGFMGYGMQVVDCNRNVITDNTIRDAVYDGININVGSTQNIIRDNVLLNNTRDGLRMAAGTPENGIYHQHSDLFMDVLGVSANHVVAAQALGADPTVCALAAQPDVPRTLSWAITHPTLTAFTLTFVGVNAKGQTVTEVYNEPTWAGETSNAFATVTSITMSAMTGNTGADSINVGITDVLGLSNVIYDTGDVYKVKKNNANAVVAGAQVDITYDTYDMAVIGLAVGDDFTIWFRSNLNIVA